MSIANRSGLLLNLATLDPPPFGSEDFVHWCCQATMSLVARDVQALRAAPTLAPGSFLAFTPSIPGMDDLPRMRDSLLRHPAQAVTRLTPVVVKDGEEVNVVVMIYEMVRGPSWAEGIHSAGITLITSPLRHLGPGWALPHSREGQEDGCSGGLHVQTARNTASSRRPCQLSRFRRIPYV